MKKLGLSISLAVVLCTTSLGQHAALHDAFWVVETHNRDTVYSIVKFFDANSRLLHEVRIEDMAIDIHHRRHRKKLDQLLADYKLRMENGEKKIRSKESI